MVRENIDEVNRKRKLEQLEAGKRLSLLQQEFKNVAVNNVQIDAECQTVERQVKRYRNEAQERGFEQ